MLFAGTVPANNLFLKLALTNISYWQLFVNTEMCVNTLQFECTTFFVEHRRDGRNYSSRDTYQCFYNPENQQFASIR